MSNRRIQKELLDMKSMKVEGFDGLKVDDSNIKVWEGVILPSKIPYNKGAFRIQITFPDNYPFKPPTVIFKTKIYHPNVDEKGNVCLGVINNENWKPATKISQVLEALVILVNDPEPEHALRVDLGEQFTKDIAKFRKSAEDFTKKHAEKRNLKSTMASEITKAGYENSTSTSKVVISSSSSVFVKDELESCGTINNKAPPVLENGEKEEVNKVTPSKEEDDDGLSRLNSDSLPGSALTRQKSATLTPTSGSGSNSDSSSSSNSNRFSPSGQNAFMNNARNNLRRSFTLPRGLLLRKSGQTGPASENQNGNFVRNIFLTLVRSKSIRKKRLDESEELVNGHLENQTNKLHGFPPGFTPAAVGLKNQGNTCFMNAIVQCLSHTDTLAKYLVTDNYKSDLRRKHWIKNGKSEVTDELASILKSAWLRQNAGVLEEAVGRFKSAVEKGALQWRGSEQHDAQEFFLWLLDRLHEDLNQASSNKYKPVKNNFGRPEEQVAAEALQNHLRCNSSIIQDIFGAQFRSSLTCPGCGKQSATFDPFLCVSLPIPQAKQEVPVYVNIIYLSQQPRQVKLGLSVSSSADIKELKQLLAADTNIEENDILLTEIDGEGFHRTFTETQLVSALANNDALYCIETPQIRETNESDGAFLMITWVNIIVTNDDKTRVRFGSTFVTQIARETGFVDLQKVLLKEMSAILQPGILVAEQKDPVFCIRILDGSTEGSLVDPSIEHPLYMESVDHALSLCDEDVPSHIKLHIEWKPSDKEKIIADEAESVEEHSSVAQTRLRHSEETISSVTLGECFDLYTTAEQLSAEDAWHCPHCNRKEQGTLKMIGLYTAPQVLVVHLKRFRQAAKGRIAATKISSVVDFPIELDLGPHVAKHTKSNENGLLNGGLNQASSPMNGCFGLGNWKHRNSFKKHLVSSTPVPRPTTNVPTSIEENNMQYELYAVCNHHGKDVLGGHYTAYCKNPVDGSWWSFDDTRVTKLSSPSEIKTASAYILFYTKQSSSSVNNISQPFSMQQQTQHWCKSLIKKYHKIPYMSNSNSVNGDSLTDKDQVTVTNDINNKSPAAEIAPTQQQQQEYISLTNGIDSSFHKEGNQTNGSSTENQTLTNGYHTNLSTKSSVNTTTTSTSSSSAPLARMEDIGMNVGLGFTKELQIESTV